MATSIAGIAGDYIDYIERVRGFAAPTVRTYKYLLGRFVKFNPDISLEDVTLQEIDLWIADYGENRSVAPSSINTLRCVLRSFFIYVDKYRRIPISFDPSQIRQVRAPRGKIQVASVDDVQKIVRTLKTRQDKLMALVTFASGMRIGELVQAQADDLRGTELTVRGKGGKVRCIPLEPSVAKMLQAYLRDNDITVGTIFRRQNCKRPEPYTVSGLRKRWQRQLEPHGLYMKPHSFRHGIATTLMQNGMDIRTLQTFLGHSHIATTMLYTQVTDNHLRESYESYFPQKMMPGIKDEFRY